MTKRVLFQADDFGLDERTNRRILQSVERGPVRGVSLLVNFGLSSREAAVAIRDRGLAGGLHFNVTEGHPLLSRREIPTLVSPTGHFFGPAPFFLRLRLHRIDPSDLRQECQAQIRQFLDLGLTTGHFDSHNHSHAMPGAFLPIESLLREYGFRYVRCPLEPYPPQFPLVKHATELFALGAWSSRLQPILGRCGFATSDHFRGIFTQYPNFTLETMFALLAAIPEGLTEIMVHPGHPGGMEVLTEPTLLPFIHAANLELLSA